MHQKIVKFKNKFNLKNLLILDYLPIQEIKYSLNSANEHIVTLGNKMKGIIHPCKIYNLIILKKPILYFGPNRVIFLILLKNLKLDYPLDIQRFKKHKRQ